MSVRKTNTFLNQINHQPGIDKIYLHAKGPYEGKYQNCKGLALKHFNNYKTFFKHWIDMQDIYKILTRTIQIEKVNYW